MEVITHQYSSFGKFVFITIVFSTWTEKIVDISSVQKSGQSWASKFSTTKRYLLFVKHFQMGLCNDKIGMYYKDILSTLLSAFRKWCGCHPNWRKKALNEGKNVELNLLDLGKAFDCLPNRLLLCKLKQMVFLMKHVTL